MDAGHRNHVPLVAVSPYTPAGLRVTGGFNHYALLRTVERTLGCSTRTSETAFGPPCASA